MNSTPPQLIDSLVWRETDDGIVVVDPVEGRVRVLNGVGSIIWKLIDGKSDESAIEQYLVEQFGISDAQAKQDVEAFLAQLKERKMIS